MTKYRTAMGKTIDMAALTAKNEKVRAVGNMSVNARGDTIDSQGKVIMPTTKKVSNNYQKTVGPNMSGVKRTNLKSPQMDLTKEEMEIEDSYDDDFDVEQLKAQERKKRK